MIIQHNIAALNTHRQMNKATVSHGRSIEKLSSGLRINRAGDDAAGLAISEKMRGQIRGLTQASQNIQDAISLIQTAEGGLQEIHSLLQRGRELSVQAANDTNTDADREALQQEVLQINEEINAISTRTEFNGMKLLRGGGSISPPTGGTGPTTPASDAVIASRKALTESLLGYMLETSEQVVANAYGIGPAPGTEITVSYVYQSPGGAVAWVASGGFVGDPIAKSFELVIDEADFLSDSPLWISKDRIIAHEMAHAMMSASGMRWMDDSIPKWFKEGSAEYIAGANERLIGDLHWAGSAENLIKAINGSSATSAFYSAGYVATKYLDKVLTDKGSSIKEFMGVLANEQKTFDEALQQLIDPTYGETAFMADFRSNGAAFINEPGMLDGTGSILEKMVGQHFTDEDVISDNPNPLNEADFFTYKWTPSTERDTIITPFVGHVSATIDVNGKMQFQVGANSGQSMEVIMPTITTDTLGISSADVKIFPSQTITSYDQAIERVSGERSKLGAIQNRLEHALSVTDKYNEQITAAESRIRDVDIAKEVMEMTKQNILLQASQAMLSTANQQPQSVLQLLR